MRVLAIDPGTHQSAYVVWSTGGVLTAGEVVAGRRFGHIERCGIEPNETLVKMLQFRDITDHDSFDVAAIEMVACYGMAVGKEVFETCVWIGRMIERCRPEPRLVYRREVKMHHCNSMKAKDANIAQALRDKYGEKGTKANPGPFFGVKSHVWAAVAVATYISETSQTPTLERNYA